jgi:hypothetical protein
MARGLDDDVCTKTPQNVYGTLGSTPYLLNENVDFDNFTCATGACQKDGCLVRCSHQVGTTLDDGAPATVGWYGSGRLHCPSASLSLYAQLRKQCPGAIVAGHNVWDCRWVKHGRAKWPNYRYTEDIANATRAVSAICPRTLKVWRSSVHLDPAFNTSKWKEMHRCMQANERVRDHAVAADWLVLDIRAMTTRPHELTHMPHQPDGPRHLGPYLGPSATRAVLSVVLAALRRAAERASPCPGRLGQRLFYAPPKTRPISFRWPTEAKIISRTKN